MFEAVDWTQILTVLIQFLIAPALLWLIKVAVQYLNEKAKTDKAKSYIALAENAILTAVMSTQQTFVDALKGTSGWDAEAMKLAFEKSKAQAIKIMGDAVYSGLNDIVGDLDEWFKAQLEAAVRETKIVVDYPLEELTEPVSG